MKSRVVLNRAEQAMYLAEKFEKNRVMTEADLVTIKERIKYLLLNPIILKWVMINLY